MSGSLPVNGNEQPSETSSLNPSTGRVEGAAAPNCGAGDQQAMASVNTDDLIFDLQLVVDSFSQCKKDDGQLHMDGYLRAYSEINKFFQILGSVFNFVAHDVQKKITILQCYRKGGAGDFYYSIQSMIEYEQENNLINNKDRQSGSRTLLRLHRALGIMRSFEPLPCPICQRSYSSPGNLKQHLENIHMSSNELNFECRICGNKFKSKWYLHKHLHRAHHIRGRKEM